MNSSTILRSARRTAGITQKELSVQSGIAQPNISEFENGHTSPSFVSLTKLLDALGTRLIPVQNFGTTTSNVSAEIRTQLASERPQDAIRPFLRLSDNLGQSHGIDRITVALSEPEPTGSIEWDAAVAGLVEYWCNRESLPVPHWVNYPDRFLGSPSSPQLGKFDLAPNVDKIPKEFRRRNILLELSTLESI
mgnify:CR=1 FL=1